MSAPAVPHGWRRRIRLLAVFWMLLAGVIVLRLYRLQIVEGAMHAQRAHQNTIFDEQVPAQRGHILDARGRLLVSNKPQYALSVTPSHLDEATHSLRFVGRMLHLDPQRLLAAARKRLRGNPWAPAAAIPSLTAPQLARLAPYLGKLPGLELQIRATRRYPYGMVASHILGYVGEISDWELAHLHGSQYAAGDTMGQSGLERQYDRALRGEKGIVEVAMDASGRTVARTSARRPTPGITLHLTLDMDLQQRAEDDLQKTLNQLRKQNGEWSGGAVIALNPNTGAVYAMASLPNFDPRPFARGITDKEYTQLIKNPRNPLFDHATQAAFPPGSTFKIVNASACLQEGICTPASIFHCSGWYKGFHCFVQSGHGTIDFYNAIALSCDATFYMLGDHLGVERLSKYAGLFGLGRPTGIDIPDEGSGVLPSPAWKKRWAPKEPWFEGETIVMSIGQGYLIATPLQMAIACATVANGGKVVRPYFVQSMTTWDRRLVFTHRPVIVRRVPVKPKYLAAVRQGMRGAVDHGTATAANSKIITISGKTGTAEAVRTVTNPAGHNHVWFVSFAPYEHPQIVCVVMVEKAGGFGGGVAAPIARDVIEMWAQQNGYARTAPEAAPSKGTAVSANHHSRAKAWHGRR